MELFRANSEDAAGYHENGWWGNDTVGSLVASWQAVNLEGVAFIADGRR